MWIEILDEKSSSERSIGFVSLRRRELKYLWWRTECARTRSSPQGDVNWNLSLICCQSLGESSSPQGDVNWNVNTTMAHSTTKRSSPQGDVNWNKMLVTESCLSSVFIPARGCELKYLLKMKKMIKKHVRLLAETWIEITIPIPHSSARVRSSPYGDVSWNNVARYLRYPTCCSSPYGDVSWNGIIATNDPNYSVRLLTETWVEMYRAILLALDRHSSSPQGDVNWNSTISCFSFQYTGSSLYGDVSWNRGQESGKSLILLFVSLRRRELKCQSKWCCK